MKLFSILFLTLFSVQFSQAQLVAKAQLKEPIEGICDANEAYALMGFMDDQTDAKCPVAESEIQSRLNADVPFLKENPKFKAKGVMNVYVNCKGEVVKVTPDTGNDELDAQIIKVFEGLGEWKAGKLNDKAVDSVTLYSFKIKKGQLILE